MFYVCNKAYLFISVYALFHVRGRVQQHKKQQGRGMRAPVCSEPPAGVLASARTCAVCGHGMLAYGIYVYAAGVHSSESHAIP